MERKTYTAKYKADCVLDVLRGDKELGEIALERGINPNILRGWKRQLIDDAAKIFGEGKRERELAEQVRYAHEERDDLLKMVGQLTLERDWLKKKSAELFGPGYEKKFGR
jgi:transposase-like protein